MAFQFRFDVLMQLRARERDEAGASVGQANQAIAKIEEQMADVDARRLELKQNLERMSASPQPMVDHLLNSGRYDLQMLAERQSLDDTRAKLTQERDRRLSRLTEVEQEVKRLERLREIDLEEHRERERKLEQAEIDEAAARGFRRRDVAESLDIDPTLHTPTKRS